MSNFSTSHRRKKNSEMHIAWEREVRLLSLLAQSCTRGLWHARTMRWLTGSPLLVPPLKLKCHVKSQRGHLWSSPQKWSMMRCTLLPTVVIRWHTEAAACTAFPLAVAFAQPHHQQSLDICLVRGHEIIYTLFTINVGSASNTFHWIA